MFLSEQVNEPKKHAIDETIAIHVCRLLHIGSEDYLRSKCVNPGDVISEKPKIFQSIIYALRYIGKHSRMPKWISQTTELAIYNNYLTFQCGEAIVPCARGWGLIYQNQNMVSLKKMRRDKQIRCGNYGR